MAHDLLQNLDKLHTTELGAERIRKNLGLDIADIAMWCRQETETTDAGCIIREGKNWYVQTDDAVITINAKSYTIITAHKGKRKQRKTAAKNDFTTEELEEAIRAISSTISKCEKVLPKLKEGTSQHTLLTRRIKALQISAVLINRELGK